MISFLYKLFIFIAIGLLLSVVPEWQNNVLMNGDVSGWAGYLDTLRVNAIFLLFAYLIFNFLNKRYSPSKTLIIQFTIWGIIGLLFEWFLIGNPPGSSAIQYGMFVYWAVVFGAPSLFVLEQAKPIRLKLLGFIILTAVLMIIGSTVLLNVDPTKKFLLLFTLASWVLIYTYIVNFFLLNLGYRSRAVLLLSVALVVSLAEIILPFPVDFLVFLAVVICMYVYVVRYLPSASLPSKY